jgi:hypothetical protein
MRRWWRLIAVLALASTHVYASDTAGAGLDLVLLIDRSESMRGERVELLPAIATELLARNAEANRLTHRLGVIGFASHARVERPLVPAVNADLRVLAEVAPPAARGHTNVLEAFATATRLFRSLPPDPARRRALVLVTDGVADVPGTTAREYSSALRRFITANFTRASLDVILVRPLHGPDRPLWNEVARVHDTPENLAAELHRVLTPLVGTSATEAEAGTHGHMIVLPPYLDRVVFDVFGANGEDVTVSPPFADTHAVEKIRLGDSFSAVVVNDPPPGVWTFQTKASGARVRVFAQQFFPRGVLVTPSVAEQVRQHDQMTVGYRLIDQDGRPLRELAGYPLSVDLRIITPEGEQTDHVLARRRQLGPAVYTAVRETECRTPGRYWTEVRVTTRDARQRAVDVFRDRWSGFSVMPAALVDCRMFAQPTRSFPWSSGVETRLECVQSGHHRSETLLHSADLFEGSLWRNGKTVSGNVRFQSLGHGAFTGVVHASWPGSYRLRVAVNRSRLHDFYNVRIAPAETVFTRTITLADAGVFIIIIIIISGVIAGLVYVSGRAHRTA